MTNLLNTNFEVIAIRVSVNDALKVIQFWLTGAEAEDVGVMNRIKKYADENTTSPKNSERYKKVIYISGSKPLLDVTGALLKANR